LALVPSATSPQNRKLTQSSTKAKLEGFDDAYQRSCGQNLLFIEAQGFEVKANIVY
jgi:hypothetical protein